MENTNIQREKSNPNPEKPAVQEKFQSCDSQMQESKQNIIEDIMEKKKQNMVLLEAALYVSGRPLDINEICSVLNTRSKKKAEQVAQNLIDDYVSRSTSMEILRLKDERFVMQVKAEFTPLVRKLVNRPLLSAGPLKTLSYIAYRQPITSKRVIEVRGQHAYGHIKVLKEMGLVATERNGRSIVLKTTDYFSDYFGLTQDPSSMKRELKRRFGDIPNDDQQP